MGALNRISNNIHPDVFIEKGDTVIFSSKIIPKTLENITICTTNF